MGPNFFARVRVIADDRFGFAPLLLRHQERTGHRERAPGRPHRNPPQFFRWIRLPVVAESQSVLDAIEIGAAQARPLRLRERLDGGVVNGFLLRRFGLAALGQESIFSRFVPAPGETELEIPPDAVGLEESADAAEKCRDRQGIPQTILVQRPTKRQGPQGKSADRQRNGHHHEGRASERDIARVASTTASISTMQITPSSRSHQRARLTAAKPQQDRQTHQHRPECADHPNVRRRVLDQARNESSDNHQGQQEQWNPDPPRLHGIEGGFL